MSRQVAMIAVLLAQACGPVETGPAKPKDPESSAVKARIVASEKAARSFHLVFIAEDGTRLADLTQASVTMIRDNGAVWSPDGKWIAFASSRGRKEDMTETSIWVIEAKVGAQPRRLTSDPSIDMHPEWTPDGKWLVYSSQRRPGEAPDLYRVPVMRGRDGNLFGGEPEPVTQTPDLVEWNPSVSPDGRWVAYTGVSVRQGKPASSAIWKRPLGVPGEAIKLTGGPSDVTPAWSPSGKQIAFVARDNGIDTDLFTIAANGTQRELVIAEALGQQTGPRWSRDGRWLFCTSMFRQLGSDKALHHSVTYTEPNAPRQKRRLCALQDPVAGGERSGPALAPERLDDSKLERCTVYQDALRTAFEDLVRRKKDELRQEYERRQRKEKEKKTRDNE